MPSDDRQLKTVDLKGVEIFATGKWNGHEYDAADLDDMVAAFSDLKGKLDPPVKLGHNDGQALLKADGYPAAGWVSKLYRKGETLVADLKDVPQKIAELVKAGAYKKVSSEIYWNYKEADKVYRRVLKAIAFLGADIPAVSSIGDIRALYAQDGATVVGYYDEQDRPVYVAEYAAALAPVSLTELEQHLDAAIAKASAEGDLKWQTGAPALRTLLRQAKAILRRLAGRKEQSSVKQANGDKKAACHALPLFKTEVGYRSAGPEDIPCCRCRMWDEPWDGPYTAQGQPKPGRCELVEGNILPHGTCDRCEMMPAGVPGDDGGMGGMGGMGGGEGMMPHSDPQAGDLHEPGMMGGKGKKKMPDEMADVMKTDDGASYPKEAYLVAADPEKPSEWKLRIWEDPTKKVTRAQLGRAAAALGPGFRGQKVDLSPDEEKAAKAKLRSLYKADGAKDEEIPQYLSKEDGEMSITEQQFSELQGRVETLTKRLEVAETAAGEAKTALAGAQTTIQTYQERLTAAETALAGERDLRTFGEHVQMARRWAHVPGKPEDIATRLVKLAKLDKSIYDATIAEYDALEALAKQSGAFREIGSGRSGGEESAVTRVTKRATVIAGEQKISVSDAMTQVFAAEPGLYEEYRAETAVKV